MSDHDTTVDEIKDKLDIVDVVQETASLTQIGDEWVGKHPKHDSKSGRSLNVNKKKQVWKCWNCGAGGDVLDWIADANDLDIRTQFQQVLEIAAHKAGIEIDRGDIEARIELQEIRTLYTAAAEYYHSNLLDVHRAAIRDKWGITDDTIDELKIGISKTTGDALYREMVKVFDHTLVEKSGLVRRTSRGWMDQFIGRIIFPYWYNGHVVYFIARQSKWTPKNKYESGKYKKLKTNDPKNDYISPQVENRYLYGMDSTRGVNDRLVITEGVTDCIAVLNGGMTCISPVTTKFRKVDCVRLLKIAKRFKEVFVCNDTDSAGIKGSIQTAEYLTVNGVDTKVVRLPVENGDDKMDIAEYLRTHTFEEFKQLCDEGMSVWDMKLAQQEVPADVTSSARTARSFVVKELAAMEPVERTAFIESDVKAYFTLSDDAVKELVKTAPEAAKSDTGFNVLSDRFLVGAKKVFDANGFAKWLITDSGYTFATLSDTDEVVVYDAGVYRNGGEVTIRRTVEQVMDGTKITKNAANEVIGHIQRRTYTERDEFDKDKRIINLKNGLYDTKTGELKPHTPDYLSTVQIPVAYDPAATCPAIDQFFIDVMDTDDIEAAVEWFGYVLEPDYWIQKMLMLLGEGENGKSKFLGLFEAFIGERNCASESIHQLVNNRFRTANLYGKLANIHADISDRGINETGILKLLTGGDRVSAEKKGKSSFKFKNFARLIFSANRLPPTRDDTDAWHRRWTFINFTRKFGKDPDATKPADPKILDKLTTDTELSGLLNRALEALKGLHERGGFSKNLSTAETRRIYTRLSDPVMVFIEDRCIVDRDVSVKRSDLFNAYVRFCEDNRQAPIGQAAFTKRIHDMGKFSECQIGSRGKRERGWRGLNIDEIIFDKFGDTLGDTLDRHEKTLTSGGGDTDDTLEKPFLAKYEKKGGKKG